MNTNFDSLLIKFYENIGNDSDLIDFFMNYDIIRSAVAGLSNKKISIIFNIEEDTIKNLLERFLEFPGYFQDLDLDLYEIYKRNNGNLEAVATEATLMSSMITPECLKTAFDVCEKFSRLERRLAEEWK